MGVVVMMLAAVGFALMSRVLTSPCDSLFSQDRQINICNVTWPYQEFCSSECCTYTAPPAFLDHLKKEHCEVAWYTPDMMCLADPTLPQNVSDPVVNITLESLITKQHVDGLFINILCHKSNKRYQAVYRVVCNTSTSPPGAPPSGQTKAPIVLGAVSAVAVLFILIAVALFYHSEWICSRICRGQDPNRGDVELEGGVGGGDPGLEEAQALNLNLNQN